MILLNSQLLETFFTSHYKGLFFPFIFKTNVKSISTEYTEHIFCPG